MSDSRVAWSRMGKIESFTFADPGSSLSPGYEWYVSPILGDLYKRKFICAKKVTPWWDTNWYLESIFVANRKYLYGVILLYFLMKSIFPMLWNKSLKWVHSLLTAFLFKWQQLNAIKSTTLSVTTGNASPFAAELYMNIEPSWVKSSQMCWYRLLLYSVFISPHSNTFPLYQSSQT